jgi:hypothetical protein
MIAEWVESEMSSIHLGDFRLDQRAKTVLTSLGNAPASSIPSAMGGGRAETEGAYRLFENERVDFDDLLDPHIESSLQRVGQQTMCVIVQDTTEIDLSRPHQTVVGTGPMDASARRGCFLHLLQAFTEQGIPLGTVGAEKYVRDESIESDSQIEMPNGVSRKTKTNQQKDRKDQKRAKAKKRQKLRNATIEEKESYRWLAGTNRAHEIAGMYPGTQIVIVSDSECDIFEVMVEGQAGYLHPLNEEGETPSADWIIRACQNRAIVPPEDSQTLTSTIPQLIFAQVEAAPVVSTYEVDIRGREAKINCEDRPRRQPRESRTATVEVRACSVILRCPKHHNQTLPDIAVNLVLVREVTPPAGDIPVEWLLVTSLPINTTEEILRVISLYCIRWQIEIFFRVLKQGCRVEERLFETLPRLERFLAMSLIVSWRTLQLSRLGRETPGISCETLFDKSEWKSVYQITQKKAPPQTPPTLGELVRMVAQLGGYVNRTKEAYPGPETIWKGIVRMNDLATAWESFGPGKLN